MKAITPVIALVMLLLITVGTVGGSYVWMSGIMTSNIEKTILIPPGGVYCRDNKISVIVQNTGTTTNVTNEDIVIADIDGIDVKNSIFFGDFDRSGLVGYWKFDEGSGAVAGDLSGNDNDGDLKPACPDCPEWVTGKFGNALMFDGMDDYADITNTGVKLTSKFSVSAWIYVNENHFGGANDGIFGDNFDSAMYIDTRYSTIRINFYINSESVQYVQSAYDAIQRGQWHHVTGTYDNGAGVDNLNLYIDGVLVKSETKTSLATPTSNYIIGKQGADYFSGIIDEVVVWNRPLEPEEIILLNKTNSGNFTLGPGQGKTILTNYPVFEPGRYAVRIGTSSGVIENSVVCS